MALDEGDLALARVSLGRLKDNAGRVVEMLGSLTATPEGNAAQTTHCDVAEVAEDVVESLAPSLKQKGIGVCRRIAAPVTASVHETDLYRILLNLLVNAIDATDGRGGTITMAAKPMGHDWVQVSVSDKGDGIAKADIAHLFEQGYTRLVASRSGCSLHRTAAEWPQWER
jgi:signal transduction histidine kinase